MLQPLVILILDTQLTGQTEISRKVTLGVIDRPTVWEVDAAYSSALWASTLVSSKNRLLFHFQLKALSSLASSSVPRRTVSTPAPVLPRGGSPLSSPP